MAFGSSLPWLGGENPIFAVIHLGDPDLSSDSLGSVQDVDHHQNEIGRVQAILSEPTFGFNSVNPCRSNHHMDADPSVFTVDLPTRYNTRHLVFIDA